MNLKQVESVKDLTPRVIKVLKKLEWECEDCKGKGYIKTRIRDPLGIVHSSIKCITCKGKGKISYSWQPQVGDRVYRDSMILFYAGIIPAINGKRAGRFISDSGTDYEWPINIVTYIPEWKTIEEVLEKAGYMVSFEKHYNGEPPKSLITHKVSILKSAVIKGKWGDETIVNSWKGEGNSRLITVYKAVCELEVSQVKAGKVKGG